MKLGAAKTRLILGPNTAAVLRGLAAGWCLAGASGRVPCCRAGRSPNIRKSATMS